MAINFDNLPKDRPADKEFSLPEQGLHTATITAAAVKTAQSGDYLEVVLGLEDGSKVWDRLFYTDKPATRYKLGRFVNACQIPLVGEMTLTDLSKVVVGRKVKVDIVHETKPYNGKEQTKAVVSMFGSDIYWPLEADAPAPATTTNTTY